MDNPEIAKVSNLWILFQFWTNCVLKYNESGLQASPQYKQEPKKIKYLEILNASGFALVRKMQLTPLKSRKNESTSYLYVKLRLAFSIRRAETKEKKMSASTSRHYLPPFKAPSGGGLGKPPNDTS